MAIRGIKWFIDPFIQMAEGFAYGTSFNMVMGGTKDKTTKGNFSDEQLSILIRRTLIFPNGFKPGIGEDFDQIAVCRQSSGARLLCETAAEAIHDVCALTTDLLRLRGRRHDRNRQCGAEC